MAPVPVTDDAFCIAVFGDFLGDGSAHSVTGPGSWEPRRATPDTVFGLTGFRPRIRVSMTGGAMEEVEFSTLESFSPGSMFQRLSLFADLRRRREEAKEGTPTPDASGRGEHPSDSPTVNGPLGPKAASEGDLLGAILEQTEASQEGSAPRDPGRPGTTEELEAFVREVVRPHRIEVDDDLPTRLAAVDDLASKTMSALLHSRPFQEIEGLWRSVVTLLSRIDTTGKIRVYLIQVPESELRQDLTGGGEDFTRSRLHSLLSAPQLGAPGRRWALAVGAYEFQALSDDLRILERIGKAARAADVPWISSIRLPPAGQEGEGQEDSTGPFPRFPEEWARLRERPEAGWLGLTHPRFLVREPHGSSPRPSEAFEFKETATGADHLLWGNGAFLCAALMAQSYSVGQRGPRPETHLDLEGMPLAGSPGTPGEPPTSVERALTLPQAQLLYGLGIIPLLGFPDRAGVRVGGLRSIATGQAFLKAWWNH